MSLLMTLMANSIPCWAHTAGMLLLSTACTLFGGLFLLAIPSDSVVGAAAAMLLTDAGLILPAVAAGVNRLESRCVRSTENILLFLDGFLLADAFLRFFQRKVRVQL